MAQSAVLIYRKMILQCLIIFACLAVGEIVVMLTGIKFPSSIIGMILLCTLLKTGVVKYEKIKGMANLLISNMGFFFIPPGIALMLYFDIIKAQFWPIFVSALLSTIIVIAVTGWVYQLTNKKRNG